jgi:hypothetical protein
VAVVRSYAQEAGTAAFGPTPEVVESQLFAVLVTVVSAQVRCNLANERLFAHSTLFSSGRPLALGLDVRPVQALVVISAAQQTQAAGTLL